MPSLSRVAAYPHAVLICRILGFCIFMAAFFLPACRFVPESIRPVYMGWECARIALSLTIETETYRSVEFLALMSGWINPLILFYLYCVAARRSCILRRMVALLILVCMAATWVFFAIEGIAPLIGHIAWIAGALIVLAPEALGCKAGQAGQSNPSMPIP